MRRFCVLVVVAAWAGIVSAAEPLDLFTDAAPLGKGYVRIGAWNVRHLDLDPESGTAEFLKGKTEEEDRAILIATFAKAVEDLALDILAVIELQPKPGAPNRLYQLRDQLNSYNRGRWLCEETHIEYDEPYHPETNPFGGLQFGILWNSARGVEIQSAHQRLLEQLRQPRDAAGRLFERRTRAPWLVPIRVASGDHGPLEFDLVVLHLKSGGAPPQSAEVNSIVQFVREHQGVRAPRHLVICGDWNIRPDQDNQGQGRPRLRQMQVSTSSGPLMRIVTVSELRPDLDEWQVLEERTGGIRGNPALAALLPHTHFNDEHVAMDTLLDHIAISRTMEPLFDHPVRAALANGSTDFVPGIEIPTPRLPEHYFVKLTDHLPVVLTLRVAAVSPSARSIESGIRIVAAVPNPTGNETYNELVYLKNFGSHAVDLRQWKIRDGAGKFWVIDEKDLAGLLGAKLAAGKSLRVRRRGRDMSLTNSGDSITLVDPNGLEIDVKTYSQANSGQFVRFE